MQCFFPQYVVEQIRTPLFVLNAAYDSWQVGLHPPSSVASLDTAAAAAIRASLTSISQIFFPMHASALSSTRLKNV